MPAQELKEFATTLDKQLQEGEERRLANGHFDCRKGQCGFDMFFTPFHIMVATDIPLKNGQFRPTNGHCTKAETGDLLVASLVPPSPRGR
jgi:hypothetical protein